MIIANRRHKLVRYHQGKLTVALFPLANATARRLGQLAGVAAPEDAETPGAKRTYLTMATFVRMHARDKKASHNDIAFLCNEW